MNDIVQIYQQNDVLAGWLNLAGIAVVSGILYYVIKKVIYRIVENAIRRSRNTYDDAILDTRLFSRMALLAPVLVFSSLMQFLPGSQSLWSRSLGAVLVLLIMLILSAALTAVDKVYARMRFSSQLPIKSYIQIVRIIVLIIGAIVLISQLIGKSPLILLSGVGALTAVLMLIFRDTILSFVASIQISSSDLMRVGDWLSAPEFNADGDVVDIALHHIKIQNWDKTISTIPTHKLVNSSYKNWRFMVKSGGRRIKRCVYIDMTTIRFCDEEMLARFKKFQLLTEYTEQKIAELEQYNRKNNVDMSQTINGRRLTNIGTFQSYLKQYLKNHPQVSDDMTFLVRQLEPTAQGLPIEIYVFANDTRWVEYENIQAYIFDHILAVVPEFDLRVFQEPSGNDFKQLSRSNNRKLS